MFSDSTGIKSRSYGCKDTMACNFDPNANFRCHFCVVIQRLLMAAIQCSMPNSERAVRSTVIFIQSRGSIVFLNVVGVLEQDIILCFLIIRATDIK